MKSEDFQVRLGDAPFRILRRVASGTSSSVYEAVNETSGERVALKVFLPHLCDDAQWVKRIEREAETLKGLNHPHIARLHGFWQAPQGAFLELEFIEGLTLKTWLQAETELSLLEPKIWILVQIARAVGRVHEDGIVHRDLKPENILLADDGTIKLTDFGLAKAESQSTMTQAGSLVGSIAYMAPELMKGAGASPRTDLFSFGVLAWEILCAQQPFAKNPSDNAQTVVSRLLEGPRLDCRDANRLIPDPVADLINRCLERDPELRPESIWQIEASLMQVLSESGLSAFAKGALKAGANTASAEAFQIKNRRLKAQIEPLLASAKQTGPARDQALRLMEQFAALFPNDPSLSVFIARLAPPPKRRAFSSWWFIVPFAIAVMTALALGMASLLKTKTPAVAVAAVATPVSISVPTPVPTPNPTPAPTPVLKPGKRQALVRTVAPVSAAPVLVAPPPKIPTTGRLRLSVPDDVQVAVDGRDVSSDQFGNLELSAGKHRLWLSRAGYLPIEQNVQIGAGRVTTINAGGMPK